jgi:hypothetical protein
METKSKLTQIQSKLKAPKGNYNEFGRYNYRSCEDILEAVKPILSEINAAITITDEIILVGDRYYIKATAQLFFDNCVAHFCTAYAREELTKKGMDAAQITGSASSYARKYALNGLLLIDDTKDPDTRDNTSPEAQKVPSKTKSNGDAYVIPFGKFKGKKLHDVKLDELQKYAQYIESAAQDAGKELEGQVLEFVLMVEEITKKAVAK